MWNEERATWACGASQLAKRTCHSLHELATPLAQPATSPQSTGWLLCGFLALTVDMSSTNENHNTADGIAVCVLCICAGLVFIKQEVKKKWTETLTVHSWSAAWGKFRLYSHVFSAFLPAASPCQSSDIFWGGASPGSLLSALSGKGEVWHLYRACGQRQHSRRIQ